MVNFLVQYLFYVGKKTSSISSLILDQTALLCQPTTSNDPNTVWYRPYFSQTLGNDIANIMFFEQCLWPVAVTETVMLLFFAE